MIFLFTDFGSSDMYVGQMKAALLKHNADASMIDLLHDVPRFDVESSAHLLSALVARDLPLNAIVLSVVDPGVGGERQPIAMQADDRWYIGPDNGLLSVIAARSASCRIWRINWRPSMLSNSFHGRDLFAPVAALLDAGKLPDGWLGPVPELTTQLNADDLSRIIYIDHYGNAMTGLRAQNIPTQQYLMINGRTLPYARTFCEAPRGQAFWYANSIGLVEISMNQEDAAQQLGLALHDEVRAIIS